MIGRTTLTVHRVQRDRYGDKTSSADHDLEGFVVVPSSSTENYGEGADQVSTTLAAYGPPGPDVVAQDSVTVPGYSGTWQVVGDPQSWPVPPGWQFGVELRLTRIAG